MDADLEGPDQRFCQEDSNVARGARGPRERSLRTDGGNVGIVSGGECVAFYGALMSSR